ncbi:hypothetical protein RQ832_06580, partial [Roseomonas sp. DSM 102946]|nr:hypothetical protein [Roseomonas sp. DSM 102946]
MSDNPEATQPGAEAGESEAKPTPAARLGETLLAPAAIRLFGVPFPGLAITDASRTPYDRAGGFR